MEKWAKGCDFEMSILNIFQFSIQAALRGRIRVLLAITAIAISVCSVMLIHTLGSAGTALVNRELDKIGFESITVFGANDSSQLSIEDATLIQESIPRVSAASPIVMTYGSYRMKGEQGNAVFWGVSDDVTSVIDIQLLYGRHLNNSDIKSQKNYVIVDTELAQRFYKRKNIVGKELIITVNGIGKKFEIIGVVKPQKDSINQLVGEVIPDFIYLPYTTLNQMRSKQDVTQIAVRCAHPEDLTLAEDEITQLLERTKQGEFKTENIAGYVNGFRSVTSIVTLIISAIAAISLCVASLGIMNTMFASVNERKKEIGICMAIGARRSDIIRCFMTEGGIISIIGGLFGGVFGIFLAFIIGKIFQFEISFSFGLFFLIESVAVILGIVFSVIPAIRAANLDPIQALRSD